LVVVDVDIACVLFCVFVVSVSLLLFVVVVIPAALFKS
jgi:hypothetical protein